MSAICEDKIAQPTVSIRDYERADLPLYRRLSSLTKRFASLRGLDGTVPFDPLKLHKSIDGTCSEGQRQAGLLLLGMANYHRAGRFDLFSAMRHWHEADRQMFVAVLHIWNF